MTLTAQDVRKLVKEPSAEVRGQLASKIASGYRNGQFSESETPIANDIFRILLKDTEKQVRRALASELSHSPEVPRDIILAFVNDEVDVAIPVIEYSLVLTEDDLIALTKSAHEMQKVAAIARRETVSERLSDALIDTDNETVMKTLFNNKGAVISEQTLLNNFDSISLHKGLLEPLVKRGGLPLAVAEKMISIVSTALQQQLIRDYKIRPTLVKKTVGDVREWEMLGLVPPENPGDPNDEMMAEELIDQLYERGQLTHSFLMRSLCMGCLNLFEVGIARLAGVPRINARILLLDSGQLGFHAIYKAAKMPEGFAEAIGILLRLSLEETEFGRMRNIDFRKRVIDRIYMEGYHRTVENMGYLLSIVGGKIATGGGGSQFGGSFAVAASIH